MGEYSLLVNTTDSFEDCWDPFFHLLSTYWPGQVPPIFLNTETKDYSYPGLDIAATRVGGDTTWSQALASCLRQIPTDVVLYVQEDYFLEAPVDVDAISRTIELMDELAADSIRLLECGGSGPYCGAAYSLHEVDSSSSYLACLQAGLWRRDSLARLLRPHESPWQFEFYGTRRARRYRYRVYANLDRSIFPYKATGIIRGRWNHSVVGPLFERHGLDVDFSIRGLYDPSRKELPSPRPLTRRAWDRLRSTV